MDDDINNSKGIPLVTLVIILMNAVIFLFTDFIGSDYAVAKLYEKGMLNYGAVVIDGEYYRLLTHFFIHDGIDHVFNNMLVLGVVGYYFEDAIGKVKYFILYMISGLSAGVVSMTWYYYHGEDVTSLGASGAVFGLTGAMIALIVADRKLYHEIGPVRIILFLILTLYSGMHDEGVDNVAHFAGFAVGFVYAMALNVLRKVNIGNED